MDLVTLENVKTYLFPNETLTTWDTILPAIISAVSEMIELEIGSRLDFAFYTAGKGLAFVVDTTNQKISFDEGGAELTATVTAGTYTGATLATAIAAALNGAAGKTLTYTCIYSVTTGKFTITAGNNFTIRWNTGTLKATDVSELMGFLDTANSTGAKIYTGYRVGEEAKASGNGTSLLHLPNWPIMSVISLIDNDDTEYEEGDDEDFTITPSPASFSLKKNCGVWAKGSGNFTAKYTAGYLTIPSDIVIVAYRAIAREWKTIKEQGWGESGKTMPDGSITMTNPDCELTKAQREILQKYKRPIL